MEIQVLGNLGFIKQKTYPRLHPDPDKGFTVKKTKKIATLLV